MRTLLVGGRSDHVERTIVPRIRRYGFEMAWHWDMDRNTKGMFRNDIPERCEAVLVLYELTPHAHGASERLREQAAARGIPCISVSRKLGPMVDQMKQNGYLPLGPVPVDDEEDDMQAQPMVRQVEQERSSTLDELKAKLVATLRTMRDAHGVFRVEYDAGARTLAIQVKHDILEEV